MGAGCAVCLGAVMASVLLWRTSVELTHAVFPGHLYRHAVVAGEQRPTANTESMKMEYSMEDYLS